MIPPFSMKENTPRILVVDFDNTLFHLVRYPQISIIRPGNRLIHAYVRNKKRKGWFVIVNTARQGDALRIAKTRLKLDKIPYDLVNDNHPFLNEKYGETRKITGTRSLDDMQVGLIGWFLRHFCRIVKKTIL